MMVEADLLEEIAFLKEQSHEEMRMRSRHYLESNALREEIRRLSYERSGLRITVAMAHEALCSIARFSSDRLAASEAANARDAVASALGEIAPDGD